ncbi:MAG: leucyl aminopeptidase [Acidobacteriota bacterium]|nr:leucyl aminopeptidase [Acidobacteriota bacterium]
MTKPTKFRVAAKIPRGTDLFILGCFEREAPAAGSLPGRIASAARSVAARKGFRGRAGQLSHTATSAPGGPSVAVWGLGKRSEFTGRDLTTFVRRAARRAGKDGYSRALFLVPEHPVAAGEAGALRFLEDLALSGYRFDSYRKKDDEPSLRGVAVLPVKGTESAYRRAGSWARPIVEGIALARDVANTPPNDAHPQWMASEARRVGKAAGMKVEVLGPKELKKRGMGGILAVGSGSRRTPRLVRLSAGKGKETIAFVGKGVTFDTGGISIKPAASMDDMKFDKCGACAVLGLAHATSGLNLPFRLEFYLPLAENMPDGAAYRPGDIVGCYNGKTVEILNTDAEGRMILADALAWAAEEKPDVLIDFATLTGACVVALGQESAGLFTDSDLLASELLAASELSREKLWRLPLWDQFSRGMKGRHADLRNTGGRWGGASTAAAFLAEFVGRRDRWAHIDMAGPAYVGKSGTPYGATGYGVALASTWLLQRAGLL